MEKHKVQYCNAKVEDFIHGTQIISQSAHVHKAQTFWDMFVHNFITLHNKTAGISTSIQNMYLHYQPCNIEPLNVDFLVVLVRVCGLHRWPCEPSVP